MVGIGSVLVPGPVWVHFMIGSKIGIGSVAVTGPQYGFMFGFSFSFNTDVGS